MPFAPQQSLCNNKYHVVRMLPQSDVATFALADEVDTNQRVVLKQLRSDLDQHQAARQFFFDQEWQIGQKLRDDPRFICAKTYEPAEKVLVLPFIEGQELAQYLSITPRPLAIDKVIAIALELAKALQALHKAGIAHGDVNLSNIRLDQTERARLHGFDCAWIASADQDKDKHYRAGVKILANIAPEHKHGTSIPTPDSDVYALGCVLCQLLTNKPDADEHKVIDLRPDTPPWLVELVINALADTPKMRRDVGAIVTALEKRRVTPIWLYWLILFLAVLSPFGLIYLGLFNNVERSLCPPSAIIQGLSNPPPRDALALCDATFWGYLNVLWQFWLFVPIVCTIAAGIMAAILSIAKSPNLRRLYWWAQLWLVEVLWVLSALLTFRYFGYSSPEKLVTLQHAYFIPWMWGGLLLWPVLIFFVAPKLARKYASLPAHTPPLSIKEILTQFGQFWHHYRVRWIPLHDENGEQLYGEPYDIQYSGRADFVVCYRPQKNGQRQPQVEIAHFGYDGKRHSDQAIVIPERDGHPRLLVHSTRRWIFAMNQHSQNLWRLRWIEKSKKYKKTNITRILTTPPPTSGATTTKMPIFKLLALDEQKHRLFLHDTDGALYECQDKLVLTKVIAQKLSQSPVHHLWFCHHSNRLIRIIDMDSIDKNKRRYSGNKRLQIFNNDYSQDYGENTEASVAGFDEVHDVITADIEHEHIILVLHAERKKNFRISAFRDSKNNDNLFSYLCELQIRSYHFQPVSLTVDEHNNIYVLGKGDKGKLQFFWISRMRFLPKASYILQVLEKAMSALRGDT